MIEFGMPCLLELPSIKACCALAHELGLSFVELNANFPYCQGDHLNADDLKRLAGEYHLYFTLHVEEECDPFTFTPQVRKAWVETIRNALLTARSLNMPIVNMHFPHGVYITLPDRKVYLYDQYREMYYDALSDFRTMCEETLSGSSTRIAIENTNGWKDHERQAIEFLLASPVFGLTLDIGHSHGIGNADEPFFHQHDDHLIHMHGHDAMGSKNHLQLGDGEIDLVQRFAWATSRGARIVLETKTITALRNSVKKLPEILAEIR